MYEDIGPVDVSGLIELIKGADWVHFGEDRDYYTWYPKVSFEGSLPESSFFLKIPPGGYIHRHRDNEKHYQTIHMPVQTNLECVSYCHEPEEAFHLRVGRKYSVERTLEHSSVNRGLTDRIHYLFATENSG